jgi:hypothetical protein
MPDVFISYSSKDSTIATQFRDYLSQLGVNAFLAEIDIPTGAKWKDSIISALNQSKWLFFLATPSSCKSTAVMHEVGAALFSKKQLIVILCDVSLAELPEWINDTQAVDLKDKEKLKAIMEKVAEEVRNDKFTAGVVAAGLLAFAYAILSK